MKLIKMDQKMINQAKAKLEKKLKDVKTGISNGDLNINVADLLKDDTKETAPPTVLMTADAYLRTRALVSQCDKEIAWHGYVERHPGNVFLIHKIIMYPQTVTGATVQTDDDKYTLWNMELPDEDISKIRFQGHSHVNMSTFASGVDSAYYDDLLQQLPDNDFYLFAITNKKDDWTWYLYDLQTNFLFEDKDITFRLVTEDGTPYTSWATEEIKEHVEEHRPTATTITPYNRGNYSGYYAPSSAHTQIQEDWEKRYEEYEKQQAPTYDDYDMWEMWSQYKTIPVRNGKGELIQISMILAESAKRCPKCGAVHTSNLKKCSLCKTHLQRITPYQLDSYIDNLVEAGKLKEDKAQ